jgi:hypothetical protein
LIAAEEQVRNFALPPIPGASQTFPLQPPGRKPATAGVPSASTSVGA